MSNQKRKDEFDRKRTRFSRRLASHSNQEIPMKLSHEQDRQDALDLSGQVDDDDVQDSESDMDAISETDMTGLKEFESTVSMLFNPNDFANLEKRPDQDLRPLWICSDGKIILEAFSPSARYAQDFLVAIAEPVSRPAHMHEYRITEYSLYAAVSVGLDRDSVITVLDRLSKFEIPHHVISFIHRHTESYGKVKLVLRDNRYWVESKDDSVLRRLLIDSIIKDARIIGPFMEEDEDGLVQTRYFGEGFSLDINQMLEPIISGSKSVQETDRHDEANNDTRFSLENSPEKIDLFDIFDDFEDELMLDSSNQIEQPETNVPTQSPILEQLNTEPSTTSLPTIQDTTAEAIQRLQKDDEMDTKVQYISNFEVKKEKINQVKQRCSELSFPALEEYDFHQDDVLPRLQMDLKPFTKLRPYQEKCLSKMFGNSRARSGIIVLPCGAGKTLVGITAACTIKKSCLVLCTSSVSVEQWAREFRHWSTIQDGQIAKFTSDAKEKFKGDAGVMISTYTMIAYSGKRAYDAQKLMDFIQSREWGFLLLDEVHVVPAEMFRKVLTIVAAHAKLGLTATLVREDNKIDNLNYLIGPKLYEANWLELASKGHIANVQCTEVWCTMPAEFFREYLKEKSRKRQLLYTMNPSKIQACQYLIAFHESLGDKVIVFSDNVFALKHYATKLNKPYIYGATSQAERLRVLQQFRFNPALNTIFISKVGDTSIDLPEANCLIQISSQYGSRRQEAQRLGRILRAKRGSEQGTNAYFYTLVSKDTEEMYFASKRQRFLIDQGYEFKIVTSLDGTEGLAYPIYTTIQERIELLNTVLLSSEKDWEDADVLENDVLVPKKRTSEDDEEEELPFRTIIRHTGSTLQSLSGGDSMAYLEFNRTSGGLEKSKTRDFLTNSFM